MNHRRTRMPLARLRLVLLDAPLGGCPECRSPMMAVGQFAVDVDGLGQPCNACLPQHVPAQLLDLVQRLEDIAAVVQQMPAAYQRPARSLVADASAAIAPCYHVAGRTASDSAACHGITDATGQPGGIPEVPTTPDLAS